MVVAVVELVGVRVRMEEQVKTVVVTGLTQEETGTQELQTEEVGVVGKVGPPALLV